MRSDDDLDSCDGGRRSERLAVEADARLKPNSWSSVEIRMLDVSEGGFRARCEARLPRGGGVTLHIPGLGDVQAQVEWQRGEEFGARFYAPIELSRCEWTLSQRHRALARLLVDRAGARQAGRSRAEAELRREILSGLTVRRGCATA